PAQNAMNAGTHGAPAPFPASKNNTATPNPDFHAIQLETALSFQSSVRRTSDTPDNCHGDDRDRTDDPLLAKQVLSQLSYVPGSSRQFPIARSQPSVGRTPNFSEPWPLTPDNGRWTGGPARI